MNPEDIRDNVPFASPVQPVELAPDSAFQFRCHPGIACFNACCKNIDITLTPYDIIRLKRRLDMRSGEFVARHTIPFELDAQGMPGLKLLTKVGTSECVFLTEDGCGVYEDRPAACRYYALGVMGIRPKDSERVEDTFFVVREPHCLGHEEAHTQTVREYRAEQGADVYDERNRDWRDVVIKKRSAGPTVGTPSARSLQLFDMCSYDMDSFRDFIRSPGFREVFDLDDATVDGLVADEDALLEFSMRFLKQVLFGERAIPLKEGAREDRIEKRRDEWARRRETEVARQREDLGRQQYED
jgi:Fe-S-cluster containining protein